ncbi:MAG: hypothetical protein ACE5F9_01270 [Phycisphaerae bacterium]
MTYRGVVKNGVVVFEDEPVLPEGTQVDVVPVADGDEAGETLPAFGIWRDRGDMSDPAGASRRIREQVERRADDD